MKSLFKVTLLAIIMVVVLYVLIIFVVEVVKFVIIVDSKVVFKNDDQKLVYVLGVSLGRYMENFFKE